MPQKKFSATIALVLLLFGVAHSKSVWHRFDTGTQYLMTSITAPDSLHLWVTGGGFLFSSTDGGLSWSAQSGSGLSGTLNIVTFIDSIHGWVFGYQCCTASKGFGTIDGGQSWTQLNFPPTSNEIRAASFIDTLNGWLTMNGDSIYCTRDGGLNWTSYSLGGIALTPYQIQFVDSANGWLGGSSSSTPLLHSSDGGKIWTAQNYLNDTVSAVLDLHFLDRYRGLIFVVIGSLYRLYGTTDGGSTWTMIFEQNGGGILKSLDFIDSLGVWWAGTEFYGGFVSLIRRSNDGGRSFADTLVQEGSGIQKIKMFSDHLGWAIDAMGGVLVYAPLILGDLNWDREITAADAVLELNRVFLGESFAAPEAAGDVNCDSRFTASDVVLLLNRVFLEIPLPCTD